MRYRSQRNKRKQQSLPELNITPLIDTALTLLIIFMVATPMLKKEQNALQIELPKGNSKEVADTRNQELVVTVSKDGKDIKIAFNGKIVQEKQLIEQLKKSVSTKAQKTVFIQADTGAPYGKVIELIDKIKYVGGVSYVALATTEAA
ncbi:MAG: biopolymer transporter ExbD [Proteobacteria bacterium]|nr:biopolymer transporter ExbD [Pseudomonadota bacterium]NBP16461.1 biopolymer transporter ExbD [bacterium]